MEIKILKLITRISERVKVPLGIKLAIIVALIVLGSIWTITTLVDVMVSSEFVRTAENTNFDINSRAASGTEERLLNIRSETLLLLDMVYIAKDNIPQVREIKNIFFERNPNIAAVIIPGVQEYINDSFFINNNIPMDAIGAWLTKEAGAVERAKKGEPILKNPSPALGINFLALFYPWQKTGAEEAAVTFFVPKSISEITGSGSNSTMVVNGDGDILIHPDVYQVLAGKNISGNPLLEALRKGSGESVRISYTEGGNRFVGAGQQVSFTDTAVFSSLEYSRINEQIIAITRRNIMFSITVMFLTILVTWFFSKTITNPVKKLTAAARRIEMGDFDLNLEQKSQDELGILTGQFINMNRGLNKWIENKNLVGRFNNKEISGKAAAGEIDFSGENKKAVVLAVNLVSFYDNCKKLEVYESLELLNYFFSKMTECTEKCHGIVDRITDQCLIALWGVPFSPDDLSDDAMNCLRSALMMRTLVGEINTERENQDRNPLRISCGINAGEVLAGRIGTSAFHKYSVTGETVDDAINAARAWNTAGTDIIITETVNRLAGERILAEKVVFPNYEDKSFSVFGLVNLAAEDQKKQRWPFNLDDVREFLGTSKLSAKE